MNLYNIIFSSVVNSLVLLLIEGIIFFTLLYSIFNNVYQGIINSLLNKINDFMYLNYDTYMPIINNITGIDVSNENSQFKSLGIKLYSVGTMYKSIITEQKLMNLNKIKSYILYSIIILGFIILIGIIYYINKKFYNNSGSNNININSLLYNIIISLVLFIIFILVISFIVFINLANNIDTNNILIKLIEIIQNKLK